MRAVNVTENGGPEVLKVAEVPVPTPEPGQLVVEVAASGVNFIDVYIRKGVYERPLPYIPGGEAAGRVVAVGDGVSDFTEGDVVVGTLGSATYAEYAPIDAARAVRLPPGIAAETAAAVTLQGLTAHFLARSIAPLAPGDTALVHAGAGGVGLLLTQLLTLDGIQVITTSSTAEKAELSRQAGAWLAIDYDDVPATVRQATGGAGVRAAFDGVGAATFDATLDSIGRRGTFVLFGASSGPVAPFDPQLLNHKGSLLFTRPNLGDFIADRAELDERAGELFSLVADGRLDVRIGGRYSLDSAHQAHRDLEGRATTGKLLIVP